MFIQLSLGAILVVVSAVLHVAAIDRIGARVRAVVADKPVPLPTRIRLSLLVFAALGVFVSHIAQIWVWAIVFLMVGEFVGIEQALYFSTVAFTTLGFGDVLVSPAWRLMAACEAAAGMLLFGLSTAFLFEVLRELLPRRRS